MMPRTAFLAALMLGSTAIAAPPAPAKPADPLAGTTAMSGLLPVHVDGKGGRILLTLPPPGPDGVSARFLYATALRTGVGSSDIGLDRAQVGQTQVIAFRRLGKKVVAEFENPRFRATGGTSAEQAAARDSFAFTTAWMGDIAATLADGSMVVDVTPFMTRDVIGVADALNQGGGKGFRLAADLSAADPGATRVFPDNIELEARQTYVSDTPGQVIENIAPDPRQVTVTVRHSLVRLPDSGYRPRRFDPRVGGFGTQAVDYGVPLGGDLVYDMAERFRLDKVDPAAPRSRVKKPIVFYIDRAAPEPIRTALAEGVSWWAKAFDAAGYIDAFQVKILPEGADPLDIRYNVVNWVNRATRGWSYGQTIADPRTGEIVKGSVLLGSLRVRQDILIFEGLVGADKLNTGGPNDPVRVALARIRQLGAHEVGHALGFEHNFAASTQDRASVMDYPAPRVGLVDGAPDLSDAYGVGLGKWDMFTVDWLYGEPADDANADNAARVKADAAAQAGLRFISDSDGRSTGAGQPWTSIWDDGADPAAELARMNAVRQAAVARFGLPALTPGEQVSDLRHKFVPIWLLNRYQVEAAAKLVGGVDFAYAVAGGGREASPSVPAAQQRAAIDALMATLDEPMLTVPPALVPLLSSGRSGSRDRQNDIEIMATAGGPVFDPLVAADVAATITLDALLDPARLARLDIQHSRDPSLPGVGDVTDDVLARTVGRADDAVMQRVAVRALLTIAGISRAPETAPGVAAILEDRFQVAVARLAVEGNARRNDRAVRPDDRAAWARGLARMLGDNDRLTAMLAEAQKRAPKIPPGMPIGGGESEWMTMP